MSNKWHMVSAIVDHRLEKIDVEFLTIEAGRPPHAKKYEDISPASQSRVLDVFQEYGSEFLHGKIRTIINAEEQL